MSIPRLENIETFLRSLSFSKPEGGGYKVAAITSPDFADAGAHGLIRETQVNLWYRPEDGFSLDSLATRVEKELQKAGLPANRAISLIVIGLYVCGGKGRSDSTLTLNEFLGLATELTLTQIFAMPIKTPEGVKPFEFGSFIVGPSNAESVKQITLRAGSPDFFELHGKYFRNSYSIQRREQTCVAIDLWTYVHMINEDAAFQKYQVRRVEGLVDSYFQTLSRYYADDFWRAFDEEQQLQVCFGAPHISVRELRLVLDTLMLSVYFKQGTGFGFVAPTGQIPGVDLASADKRIPEVLSTFKSSFGFKAFTSSNFDNVVLLFTKYMYRGRQRQLAGEHSDAFLSYVIALDLLFGERNSSVESTCRRSAIVVYKNLGVDSKQPSQE